MQNGDHLQKMNSNNSACVGEAENPAKHEDTTKDADPVKDASPANHAGRANNL